MCSVPYSTHGMHSYLVKWKGERRIGNSLAVQQQSMRLLFFFRGIHASTVTRQQLLVFKRLIKYNIAFTAQYIYPNLW
jgi:hypothetical protein